MTEIDLNERFASSCGSIAHGVVGAGPDVVLVHGTPANAVVWSGVVARLKHRYRFHLLDLPGYGASEKAEGQEVRLRSFAQVLAEWLKHKGLEKPVLVGHDFGAGTVCGAHLVEGVEAAALCICDGVVLSPWGTAFSRHVKEHKSVFAAVPDYVHRAMLEAHLRTAVARPMPAGLMEQLVAPWLGEEGQPAYYRQIAQYDYQYTDRLEDLYPSVACPTQIFWGEEGRWVDKSEGARLAEMIPGASLDLLPDAGHFAMVDTPGLLARGLDRWLSGLFGA